MWGSKLTEESCLNRVGSVRRGRRPVVALALLALAIGLLVVAPAGATPPSEGVLEHALGDRAHLNT